MQQEIRIVWDIHAKTDLRLIHDFIKLKSPQGAKNVLNDILSETKNIKFVQQKMNKIILVQIIILIVIYNYLKNYLKKIGKFL